VDDDDDDDDNQASPFYHIPFIQIFPPLQIFFPIPLAQPETASPARSPTAF